ncbi:hypothetical protein PFICI_14832 [Pestalotiopsis fici W106-1]|uniref:Fucose-specific lectin n=1 Tax=Pestalotiopsis fici (strain W106-1 / CGMCC3.15140) TaxID=1229662 RepID=W3WM51_PESFW|nr:uncharacterized protein PFICI_14832 [Pestalotiopsis fici W106-1]ETS73886.1 hypothetical protein PFICI_14832 [Pestalotiopsis fici W106-1]
MASQGGGANYLHEQPGLEVNHHAGLEVDPRYAPRPESEGLQTVSYQQEKAYTGAGALPEYHTITTDAHTAALSNYDGQPPEVVPAKEGAGAGAGPKRKLTWIIVGAIIAVVVIVGAVVGGVVGSRAAKSSSSSHDDSTTSGNSSSSSTTNATSLENIRPLSRIAATGWRDGGVARIRIFYQGPDMKLRTSWYANNETSWSDPTILTELEYEPGTNTTLAASCSVETTSAVQYKMIYLDGNSTIRGHGFTEGRNDVQGERMIINDYPITVPSTSRLASYWPFVMAQNDGNNFQWIRYWGANGGPDDADAWWTNSTLNVIGSEGTGMVVVPSSAWYLDDGGFIYRRSDGKLKTYEVEKGSNNVTGLAWGDDELSYDIPSDTAIGSFVIARPDNSNNYTNTYILYQDDDGIIQVMWQDDESGWKGPSTYDAFNGADMGTDITCVTAAAWDGSGIEVTSNENLSRCYFQVSNQLREVSYDGTDWTDKGYLPIT